MRRPFVAANWKMHGRTAMAERYAGVLAENALGEGDIDVVVCPPTPYLRSFAGQFRDRRLALGAQDCSVEQDDGAYTGEVSASMLADSGCRWVVVGHSERRRRFGESDAVVARKFAAASRAGLRPILCVGESEEERGAGRADAVVERQLDAVLEAVSAAEVARGVIAYEPVWAIGSGRPATPEDAAAMHRTLRAAVQRHDADAAAALRVVYGGSVTADNAGAYFARAEIDGALVGGACLDPAGFIRIAAAALAAGSETEAVGG